MSEGTGASAPSSNSAVTNAAPAANTNNRANNYQASSEDHAKIQAKYKPESSDNPTSKKLKVKVDGKELELDESEVIRDYQLKKASDKRFQEAAAQAKQAQQIMQALENGDLKFIESKLGKAKAKSLFEDYLIQDMEYEQLSPAEKRAMQLEQENKSLKQRQEEAEKASKEAEYKKHLERAHDDLNNEVHQALQGLGAKPTPRLAVRVVDEMIARMEAGKEAIPAADASKRALAGIKQDIAEYLPTIPIDDLVKLLPQKTMDALREYEVKRVIGDKSRRRSAPTETRQPRQSKPVGVDEWFNKIEQRFNK